MLGYLHALLGRLGAPCPAATAPAAAERLLERTRSFYVALDQDGIVRSWNPAAAALFGHSREYAVGRPVDQLIVAPSSRAAHHAGIERFLRTGRGRGIDEYVEVEALRADGTLVPVELSIWAEHTASGWVFHATGHDPSRQRQHAQVLEVLAAHRRGLLLSEHPDAARRLLCTTVRQAVSCEGVYLYEPDDEDPSLFRLTAEARELAAPGPPSVAIGPTGLAYLQAAGRDGLRLTSAELDTSGGAEALRATGLQTFVIRPLLRREQVVGVLLLGWLAADRDTTARDPQLLDLLATEAALVFERLTVQEELRQAALTDPLTGLVNRREHDRRLSAAVVAADADGGPLSLLVLDLDRFKVFNDTHGHPRGDALLVEAAGAWTAELDGEGLLARVGGDEFAVLLPGADGERAAMLADRLRAATPTGVGLTVGRAVHVRGGTTEDLLQAADADLYAHKRAR